MKNMFLMLSLLMSHTACLQTQKGNLTIALCEKGKGCTVVVKKYDKNEITQILKRPDLFSDRKEISILVIENCNSRLEEKLSLAEIHQTFGGKGEPKKISSFDTQKYLKEKGCLPNTNCPNTTKKISFYISGNGQSGNGYFFLNIKAREAYMPNAASQQLMAGQEETENAVIDQFLRNNTLEIYTIAEGKKIRQSMPLGASMELTQNDAINEKRFKDDFKKTGNTRKHLNTSNIETEYRGKDDEGKTINFWITPPVNDVCLSKGKFDAYGFYNLGYISVDGITYLVTEISGSGFQLKVTDISNGSYNFNSSGYQSY